MNQSKNAIGNLIARYKAILKQCSVLNTFGSLAMAAMVVAGSANVAMADAYSKIPSATTDYFETYSSTHNEPNYSIEISDGETEYYDTFTLSSLQEDGTYIDVEYGVFLENEYTSVRIEYGTSSTIDSITSDYVGASVEPASTGVFGGAIRNSGDIGYITADFIGNSGTNGDNTVYGGAIYNSGDIGYITGDFISNSISATSEDNPVQGGAISNRNGASIGNITGNFIDNTATNNITASTGTGGAQGGAIANYNAEIDDITGDFIGNSVITEGNDEYAHGGAIFNQSVVTLDNYTCSIGNILGDFIGNSVGGTAAYSYGGAIYNAGSKASIGTITGDFIGNNVTTTGSNDAAGGAIYTSTTIGTITGSFIGNYVSGPNASGGAIYTSADMTFANGGGTITFSDNYTDDGTTKDYNAIYASGGVALTFEMTSTGNIVMNDSILGNANGFTVLISGEELLSNTFYLNDEIDANGVVTVSNATLELGTYTHDDGTTKTVGSVDFSTLKLSGNSTLAINAAGETINPATSLTIDSGEGLVITSGTFDISDYTLTVASDASTFATGTNGTLIVNAADFGVTSTTSAVTFSTGTGTVAMTLSNSGNLVLEGLSLTELSYDDYTDFLSDFTLANGDGTVRLDGVVISGLPTYLADLASGSSLATTVIAGTLANDKTVLVSGVTGSETTINNGTLTLTGEVDGVLSNASIENNSTLILGSDSLASATVEGSLTTSAGASTTANSSLNIEGDLASAGDLTFINGVSVTGATTLSSGTASFSGTSSFTGTVSNTADTTFNGTTTFTDTFTNTSNASYAQFNGATTFANVVNGGSITINDTAYFVDYSGTGSMTVGEDGKAILNGTIESMSVTNAGSITVNGTACFADYSGTGSFATGEVGTASFASSVDFTSVDNDGGITLHNYEAGFEGTNEASFAEYTGDGGFVIDEDFIVAFNCDATFYTFSNSGVLNLYGTTYFTEEYKDSPGTLNVFGATTFNAGYSGTGTLTIGDADNSANVSIADGTSMTIASGASLTITNGTLDVSNGTLTVASDATTFATGTSGTLMVNAADFGVAYDTSLSTGGTATVAKTLTNDGTLVLTGFDDSFTELGFSDYANFLDSFTLASGGTVSLDGVTITTAGESLDDLTDGMNFDEQTIEAGELSQGVTASVGGLTGDGDTTNNGTLTLTGQGDADSNGDGVGTLAQGDITNEGTLVLGSEGTTSSMETKLTNEDSAEVSTAGTTSLADVDNKGTFNAEGDTTVETFTNSGTLNVTGTATLGSYTAETGASTTVGDDTSAGTLVAQNVNFNGTTLLLDPDWTQDADQDVIANATKSSLAFEGDAVNALATVGRNSYLVLGDGTEAELVSAEAAFASYGLIWGENAISAALFINKAYTVASNSGLYVDGTATEEKATANSAYFANQSLLAVDADNIASGTAALSADSITVVEGASLLIISNGLSYDSDGLATVTIVDADTTLMFEDTGDDDEGGAWGYSFAEDGTVDTSTIYVNSSLMEVDSVTLNEEDGTYSVTVSKVASSDAYGSDLDSGLASLIDGLDTTDPAYSFFANTTAKGAQSVANVSIAAGTMPALGMAGTAGITNVQNHNSMTVAASPTSTYLAMNGDGIVAPSSNGPQMTKGFGVWAMPMYKHTSADGFSSGDFDYGFDADIYGMTLGMDYTFDSDLRLGAALHVGMGESESSGDYAKTENDFDYFGLSLYAAKYFNALALTADIGFMASDNDIEQAGGIRAEADALMLTAGVKAEYRLDFDAFALSPYAGIRINHYDVDAYDTKQYGVTLVRAHDSDSTIVEFPLGLGISTTMQSGGWTLMPNAALGVKFAAGDLDADQKVSLGQNVETTVLSSEVADAVTFQGALGLGMSKDAYSIDFGYTLDLSENVESHGVSLNLRYEF